MKSFSEVSALLVISSLLLINFMHLDRTESQKTEIRSLTKKIVVLTVRAQRGLLNEQLYRRRQAAGIPQFLKAHERNCLL